MASPEIPAVTDAAMASAKVSATGVKWRIYESQNISASWYGSFTPWSFICTTSTPSMRCFVYLNELIVQINLMQEIAILLNPWKSKEL